MMNDSNWRTKTLILGALIGALLGAGTAYLLARTAEESGGGPPQISVRVISRATSDLSRPVRSPLPSRTVICMKKRWSRTD